MDFIRVGPSVPQALTVTIPSALLSIVYLVFPAVPSGSIGLADRCFANGLPVPPKLIQAAWAAATVQEEEYAEFPTTPSHPVTSEPICLMAIGFAGSPVHVPLPSTIQACTAVRIELTSDVRLASFASLTLWPGLRAT